MCLILISNSAGQVGEHFINFSFYLNTGTKSLDGIFRSMSQMKAYNFFNHRKIASQHF